MGRQIQIDDEWRRINGKVNGDSKSTKEREKLGTVKKALVGN